jgi:hypothetical protein
MLHVPRSSLLSIRQNIPELLPISLSIESKDFGTTSLKSFPLAIEQRSKGSLNSRQFSVDLRRSTLR